MFTQNDLRQFLAKGIDPKVIEQQIENFKSGFPYVELIAEATISNGIKSFSDAEADKLILFYDKNYDLVVYFAFRAYFNMILAVKTQLLILFLLLTGILVFSSHT